MKPKNWLPIALLSGLFVIAFAESGRVIHWPGEAWYEGVTNVDGLKPVFALHSTPYDRRYLIQALPYFCVDHQITYLPAWLVQEVGSAIDDNDPQVVIEGIVAAHSLGLTGLSPNLARAYMRARMLSIEDMPNIHQCTAATLVGFNADDSRKAIADIINEQKPAPIVTDVVPVLRALAETNDTICFQALDNLSTRVKNIKDSLSRFKNAMTMLSAATRADSVRAIADSTTAAKIDGMVVFVDRIKNKIRERAGSK